MFPCNNFFHIFAKNCCSLHSDNFFAQGRLLIFCFGHYTDVLSKFSASRYFFWVHALFGLIWLD